MTAADTASPRDFSSGLSVRAPMLVGIVGLVLLLGGFGYWAAFTYIAGAVTASGSVALLENRQIVQHLDGGIVSELHVREGQTVAQGDMLLRLDDTFLRSELWILEGELFSLQSRRKRLEAERDGAETMSAPPLLADAREDDPRVAEAWEGNVHLFEARRETMLRQVEQLQNRQVQTEQQRVGVSAQHESIAQQIEIIESELSALTSLVERGLSEMPRLQAMRRDAAALAGRLGELEAKLAELAGRVVEIDMEILRMQIERREQAITEIRDVETRENELLERRRAVLDRLSRLDIRAPVGGVIYDQQVFGPMAVTQPAQPIMYIVPQDRPLVIHARVDPMHVDEVFVGQEVSLQFSALDQRTVPPIEGYVRHVSPDVFESQSTGEMYYLAEIDIAPDQVDILEGIRIVPGMPVDAFIRTGERTPIRYLTQPLMDYFNRAFRER
ncbi:MAG: HlyD family type I secretion periplasmic adaptor subunit [Rhodobacteraceae bacterium]|nr:HlyD family type I secretion periplasmic adaptor subunit [Paracoccaceae bacterium]